MKKSRLCGKRTLAVINKLSGFIGMAIQFILGPSGTGKSSLCIKQIVNALLQGRAQRLVLLVPEQATYQAERAILSDSRVAGYSSGSGFSAGRNNGAEITAGGQSVLNVVSFARLQYLLVGKNTVRRRLSRTGRQMIIHKILRDNKDKFKALGLSAVRCGLAAQMAETISELNRWGKTPQDIECLINGLRKDGGHNSTTLKFSDIRLVLSEYLRFIEGRFVDEDVELNAVSGSVGGARFIAGARLWVDGFSGFTTTELVVLMELFAAAAETKMTLCLDASSIDVHNPDPRDIDAFGRFGPSGQTYAEIMQRIKKRKLQVAEPVILDKPYRFTDCAPLAHLQQRIFTNQAGRTSAGGNVRIIAAANQRSEVRFVAKQIALLVRQRPYRYRDIAVIVSDIGVYEHYIRAYFEDYNIPFFLDRPRPLNLHPVVGLISAAMAIITGGFRHADIFAYLKTDLVPVEPEDVDQLENYCLAFGVTGSDWTRSGRWQFAGGGDTGFNEEKINIIRDQIAGPLLKLREGLCPESEESKLLGADEFTRIIFDFFDQLHIQATINNRIEQARQEDNYELVDQHRQFYDKFVEVFDEMVEVFAGGKLSCEDCVSIINMAFSQLKLALIPPGLDEVLVGSIERSRHPDLKAVFLTGTTQRQFPCPVVCNSILTDDDRMAAESADFALAAGTDRTLAERQYLAYIAFTRASEFLCVTYPAVSDKGTAIVRSQFIAGLELLFENLSEESVADDKINPENIHTDAELADLLCSRLGKDPKAGQPGDKEQLDKLLADMCTDASLGGLGARVRSALDYDNSAGLDKTTVAQLSGSRIESSATRLATFAACPYQYFARYVLELEERKEFKLRPLEVGDFYHRVLDALLKQLKAEGKDFATLQDDQLLKILRQQIVKIKSENRFISNFARGSAHNSFIISSAGEVLADCVAAIAQMVRAGSFRPVLSEVSFGRAHDSGDTLGQYRIGLPDGRALSLNGKIDRLDIAEADGEKTAIVFDYKKSKDKASFNWARFYHGMDMQLPIYMLAVRNAKGAFYMPIEISPPKVTLDELSEKTDKFAYKAKGIFNGEFAAQLDGQTDSGWSKFYNLCIVKGGDQYGNYGKSGALNPVDFEKILKFTERKIVELTQQILSGRIDVKPYRLSGKSPCSYCRYKPVCRFDWQVNEYNFLASLGKAEVLKQIGD